MEGRKFDELTRFIGRSQSRRSMLKGLLGIGGVAAAASVRPGAADARTIGARPTVPPAPTPACQLPMQMCGGQCCGEGHCKDGVCCPNATDVLCGGACCATGLCTASGACCGSGEQICGAVCCPASTSCAINGNTDYCCDAYPCGYECCGEALQCCDRECCGDGAVCLSQVFAGFAEEYCCPVDLTCGGGCCDGACFTPSGSGASGFDRSCCPQGGNLCPGTGGYAGTALCCSGETPDCCNASDGSPVCLTVAQCCTSAECGHLTDPAACLAGICNDFSCGTQTVCGDGETCCLDGGNTCCPPSQVCCGPTCCGTGLECCERDVQGVSTFACYDADAEGACCFDNECPDNPATCEEGVCRTDQTCGLVTSCEGGEKCCEGDAQTAGACRVESLCCIDSECPDDVDECLVGVCEIDGCQQVTECGSNERCCRGNCLVLEFCCDDNDCEANARCRNDSCVCMPPYLTTIDGDCVQCHVDDEDGETNCRFFGFDTQCVECISGICTPLTDFGDTCELANSGNQGYCFGETGLCVPCLESGIVCTDSLQCCGDVVCAGTICGGTSTTPDPSCSGIACEPNEVCSAGECECPYPFVVNNAGACVQCDSDDVYGDDNCEFFGLNNVCVDCINGVCSAQNDLGEGCQLAGSGDQGYCLGNTGFCVPCLNTGVLCTSTNQCCDDDCIDGYCGGPPECRNDDDCGPCEFCEDRRCITGDCTVFDGCCDETQFCDDRTGFCEACGQVDDRCSGFPFRPCCGDLLCSNSTCATCVSHNQLGCSDFADCCEGPSKFCASGACRCGTPTLFNICSRDGDECCDQYACVTTQSFSNPLQGTCQEGTCSSTVGGSCPCCAGFYCATDNTCVNACNFSDQC